MKEETLIELNTIQHEISRLKEDIEVAIAKDVINNMSKKELVKLKQKMKKRNVINIK